MYDLVYVSTKDYSVVMVDVVIHEIIDLVLSDESDAIDKIIYDSVSSIHPIIAAIQSADHVLLHELKKVISNSGTIEINGFRFSLDEDDAKQSIKDICGL